MHNNCTVISHHTSLHIKCGEFKFQVNTVHKTCAFFCVICNSGFFFFVDTKIVTISFVTSHYNLTTCPEEQATRVENSGVLIWSSCPWETTHYQSASQQSKNFYDEGFALSTGWQWRVWRGLVINSDCPEQLACLRLSHWRQTAVCMWAGVFTMWQSAGSRRGSC